jgi:hypothetical protein
MLGAEAERMSRVMDTRNPLGIQGLDAADAGNILGDLLNSPGIFNLNNAFAALNGMAALSQTTVRRGMGGGIWDAAIVKAAAADLARETNAELAAREARILAANVRLLAEDAVKSLAAEVDAANGNFRSNMDEMFINEGQWTKSGKDYIKEIIVYSTLFNPVITEKKSVSGYYNFIMDPVDLAIDFDDNILANLDFNAINWLIDGIYAEIGTLAGEIFGTVEEAKANEAVAGSKNMNGRGQAPGKFGAYIGYAPLTKENAGKYKTRKEIFHDEGKGEQGRLISDFIFWQIIDNQGVAAISVPGWDKPMWDDRNSFFDAPSIRSTVDLAVNIGLAIAIPLTGGGSFLGMVALMTAVNSADDLLFSGLDVASGYKTLGEAGFEFGKAVLTNAASSAVSGVFGGLEGVKEGVFQAGKGLTEMAANAVDGSIAKLAVKTAMTGAQVATTGLISSAIGGVTYDRENGWGYSEEAFKAGMGGVWKSAVSSMTATLTTGSLNLISNGLKNERLNGFSSLNQKNVGILNSMLGEVAGQGIQYAMGNDFTLNLLNISLIPGVNASGGLLEMHFGHDRFSMKFGSGGADISRVVYNFVKWGLDALKAQGVAKTQTPEAERMAEERPEVGQMAEERPEADIWKSEMEIPEVNEEKSFSYLLAPDMNEEKLRDKLYELKTDGNPEAMEEYYRMIGDFTDMINWVKVVALGDSVTRVSQEEVAGHFETLFENWNSNVKVPGGDSLAFGKMIMTPEKASQLTKDAAGYYTCNKYFQGVIKEYLGEDVFKKIFMGNEGKNTNELFDFFKTNPNLERIHPNNHDDLSNIQALADSGALVFMIAKRADGDGHIALIGHSGLEYYSAQGTTAYEGNGQNLQTLLDKGEKYHVTVIQGGAYPGVNSLAYATNKLWDPKTRKDLLDNSLWFYTVKK